MAKRTRNMAMAAVAAAVLGMPRVSAAADANAMVPEMPAPHVRSSNSELVDLMQQATERSRTFRGLVDTINHSDSIVFVNKGRCGHGVRACFVNVTFSSGTRYMFVLVDIHETDAALMGSIAHELRHTIEVIGEPNIRDYVAKFYFYEKIASRDDNGAHETRAAIEAGNTVRAEVRRFASRMRSE